MHGADVDGEHVATGGAIAGDTVADKSQLQNVCVVQIDKVNYLCAMPRVREVICLLLVQQQPCDLD